MATETLDFNFLHSAGYPISSEMISVNFDVGTYELEQFFYPYHLYVEERIENDIPKDSKTNLYNLFNAGINNLAEEDWKITVSERISSHTQIYCTNNYQTITANFYSTTGDFDKIHYDEIVADLSDLDSLTSFREMSGCVMDWINEYVNDFTINQNPENSDDSNLILTQALKANIQDITEKILKKVFRNLMQVVRYERDYRMYGPKSTIYGNCYKNDISCQNFTAVPASCFTQRGNHYMIGKKAYEDNITSVGGTIANAVWHIAPSASYALAKHTHSVSINMGSMSTTVGCSKTIVTGDVNETHNHVQAKFVDSDDGPGSQPWNEQAGYKDGGVCDFSVDSANPVQLLSAGKYHYSWDSSNKNYCKLVEKKNWNNNPWSKNEVVLPTYAMRVWTWNNNPDGTNISTPTQYITGT